MVQRSSAAAVAALAKAVKWRWISSKRITALRTMLMSWFR